MSFAALPVPSIKELEAVDLCRGDVHWVNLCEGYTGFGDLETATVVRVTLAEIDSTRDRASISIWSLAHLVDDDLDGPGA